MYFTYDAAANRLVYLPARGQTEDDRRASEAKTWGRPNFLRPSALAPGGLLYIVATDCFGLLR